MGRGFQVEPVLGGWVVIKEDHRCMVSQVGIVNTLGPRLGRTAVYDKNPHFAFLHPHPNPCANEGSVSWLESPPLIGGEESGFNSETFIT